MEKQLVALIKIINKEVVSLENFLKLLKEEEEYLLNNHFDLLENSIQKQEKALNKAKELEDNRKEITSWISKDLKIALDKTSLHKLAKLLNSSYSSKLDELQETLLLLHRKVETQRKRNEELIRKSMVYIDRGIKLLIESEPSPYLSNSTAEHKKSKPSLILDKVS